MEYTTLERLKTFLGIADTDESQDADLTILITQATALVDLDLGNNLEEDEFTRRIDGTGERRIIMETKITEVASITDVTTSEDIEVDYIDGSIIYLTECTTKGRKNVQIVYTKGYSAVPADMERFFWHYCRELLNQGSSSDTETVKSQSLGGGLSLTYFSPSELKGRIVDMDVVMAKYRIFSL